MTSADVITLISFIAAVLAGLAVFVFIDLIKQRPASRIRARLFAEGSGNRSTSQAKVLADLHRAQSDARRRRRREVMGTLGYYLNRLETVAGPRAARFILFVAAGVAFVGLLLVLVGVVPRNIYAVLIVLLGLPALVIALAYTKLVNKFKRNFINQLPEAMDAIVRASQAGVPVTHSIRSVGDQFTAPLGPEFRKMGDSLLLGNDLEEVLDDAVIRIELPDFSFLAVCILLQRESGGSIVEALENLSGIIRARRDLGLKAKALTAEGRLSGMFMAALPFIVIAMLYFGNREYVEVLFYTESGRKLLWIAGAMLVFGIVAIRRITNMKV